MLREAEALKVVRDGYATFFIHPFVIETMEKHRINGLGTLKSFLEELRGLGYEFVDIKEIDLKIGEEHPTS